MIDRLFRIMIDRLFSLEGLPIIIFSLLVAVVFLEAKIRKGIRKGLVKRWMI